MKLAQEKRLSFGALLRELRETSGLTQKGLIAAATLSGSPGSGGSSPRLSGLVVTALSHWEDNRRVPLPPQLDAVSRVLRTFATFSMPDFDADLLALITLARDADHRYAGLVSMWESGNLPAADRLRSWGAWAATFPLRPPRGRAWENDELDENDEESGLPSGESLALGLGVTVSGKTSRTE